MSAIPEITGECQYIVLEPDAALVETDELRPVPASAVAIREGNPAGTLLPDDCRFDALAGGGKRAPPHRSAPLGAKPRHISTGIGGFPPATTTWTFQTFMCHESNVA